MPESDNPLKLLITGFADVYAEWLLHRPVKLAQPLNIELPADAQKSDLLFFVTLADGTVALLHIELQGRRTHRPMPWRMLDYMSRLTVREFGEQAPDPALRLHSVVLYLERGAGANDAGAYTVLDVDGAPALQWRYDALLLWQQDVYARARIVDRAALQQILTSVVQVEKFAEIMARLPQPNLPSEH